MTTPLTRRTRQELIHQHKAQKKAMRKLPCKPADNKKFTFVRYADDWLAGVCGTKAECEELKAEIAEFLSTELKLTLSEEKTLITHSSEKVRFIGYDICVRRNQEVKGHRMKNGTWRKSRTLHMKVALSIPIRKRLKNSCLQRKSFAKRKMGSSSQYTEPDFLTLRITRLWNSTMPKQEDYATITIWLVITTRWITSAISWNTVALNDCQQA